MKRIMLLALLCACASTQTASDPDKPFVFRVRSLDPPPAIMAVWLSELEACSGLSAEGQGGSIKYMTAERIIARGEAKLASIHGDSITLRADKAKVKLAVQHEQMHWLLRNTPTTSDHPAQYFNGACGNLGT